MTAVAISAVRRAGSTSNLVAILAAALAAAAFGALVAGDAQDAMLLVVLVPLALAAPMTSLAVVLFGTVLVPFDTLNHLSVGGGADVPGLLPVDLVLGLALCRQAARVATRRSPATTQMLVAAILIAGLVAALAHGVVAGAAASDAGTEARCLVFGVGTFLLAAPLLAARASRARIYVILVALGIALGLWGIAQVTFDVAYSSAGDVGVRPGIDQIAAVGGGQLQGGLYAFPIAVIVAFAALISPSTGHPLRRLPIAAVFALNAVCVLLTYERSIWGGAAIGCVVAAARSGRGSWPHAGRWVAVGVAGLLAYGALSPSALSTSIDRIESVFRYQSDSSAQARKVESAAVLREIRRDPVAGAGFGATVTWGGGSEFGVSTTNFTHMGYLWLAWKAGVPLALAIAACMLAAALRRGRRSGDAALDAFRAGCQAALLASLLVCFAFPEFNALGVTAVLGLLVAGSLAGYSGRDSAAGAATTV